MAGLSPVSRPVNVALTARAAGSATPAADASTAKFKSVDAYETFVRSSDVMKMPQVKAAVAADQNQVGQAAAALEAQKRAVGYDAAKGALDNAAAQFDVANHPGRGQAAQLTAEVGNLSNQSAQIFAQMSRLQTEISSVQADNSYNQSNVYNSNPQTLGGALFQGAISVASSAATASTVSNDQKQIGLLAQQKAGIDVQIMTKTAMAANLAQQPGEESVVKPFRDALTTAQQNFNKASDAIQPQAAALARAQGVLSNDSSEQNRLQTMEGNLKNVDDRFGAFTRLGLWKGDHDWKAKIDTFWKQLGV